MNRTSNLMTTLLFVFGAMVIMVIAWFLLISPRLGAAADADAQRLAAIDSNALLETQIAALKVDFENLPALREKLWELRDQFPATHDVAGTRELLEGIAVDNGLYIYADTFAGPQVVIPGLSLAGAYAAIGQESYVEALVFENLIETSVTVTTTGSLSQVLGFLDDVQLGDHRYFLVTGFTIRPVPENLEAHPPIPLGYVELTITARIYTLDYGNPDAILRPAAEPMPGDFLLPSEEPPPPSLGDRDIFVPVA